MNGNSPAPRPSLPARSIRDRPRAAIGRRAPALAVEAPTAPGNLKSISSWGDVERHLRGGFALAIHVRAAAGELDGAPQNASERRWIVLTGLDGEGGCQTQDPAALGGKGASVTYSRTALERVWMAHGGTTIVLDPPRKSK